MSHLFQPARQRTNALAIIALIIAAAAVFWALALARDDAPAKAAPAPQLAPGGGLVAFAEITVQGQTLNSEQQQYSVVGNDDVAEMSIVDLLTMSATVEGDTRTAGRSSLSPITITKRIDATSPILLQALRLSQVTDVTVYMYWNDPDTGDTQRAYRYEFVNARIVGIRHSATSPGIAGSEVIALSPAIIRVIDEVNSIEVEWDLLTDSTI